MSSEKRPPDDFDADLDAFLRGEDASSRAYQAAGKPQPPADVDAAVLRFARDTQAAQRGGRRRWLRPLALAAALVLGVSVTLELWRDPQVRSPVPEQRAAALPPVTVQVLPESREEPAPPPPPKLDLPPVPLDAAKPLAAGPLPQAADRKPKTAAQRRESAPAPSGAAPSKPAAPAAAPAPLPAPVAADTSGYGAASYGEADAVVPSAPAVSAYRSAEAAAESQKKAEASRSASTASALAQAKRAAISAGAWQAPLFDTLRLGQATREQVHARNGDPSSKGVSDPDDTNPDRRRLDYDAYERLPGRQGLVEFYYERLSGRLLGVRQVLAAPVPAAQLVESLGWREPPQIRSWRNPPCGAEPPATQTPNEAPFYWLYPQRGAYLFLPVEGQVEQIVYEAQCD